LGKDSFRAVDNVRIIPTYKYVPIIAVTQVFVDFVVYLLSTNVPSYGRKKQQFLPKVQNVFVRLDDR
jgi:hypothetical protein